MEEQGWALADSLALLNDELSGVVSGEFVHRADFDVTTVKWLVASLEALNARAAVLQVGTLIVH